MEVIDFKVLDINRDIFESRLEKLVSACEVNETHFAIKELGTEKVKMKKPILDEFSGKNVIQEVEVEFDKYQLEYEQPENLRYEYVGLLKEVGNSNLFQLDTDFKEGYAENENYDISIPDELYSVHMECEHCHSGRVLKKSHVLFDFKNDWFFQVASGCMTGYLYFNQNRNVTMTFEELMYDDSRGEGGTGNRRQHTYRDLNELLLYSLTHYLSLDKLNYISNSNSNPAKKIFSDSTLVRRLIDEGEVSEEAEKKLDDLLHFLSTDSKVEQPNTSVMIKEELVPDFKEGYLIYLTFRFLKSLEYKDLDVVKEEVKQSDYMGEVGEKLVDVPVTFFMHRGFDTDYGFMNMFFFKTEEGNVLVWRTGKDANLEEGNWYMVTGKVKDHKPYNGVKQTFLTYVKAVEIEQDEEE